MLKFLHLLEYDVINMYHALFAPCLAVIYAFSLLPFNGFSISEFVLYYFVQDVFFSEFAINTVLSAYLMLGLWQPIINPARSCFLGDSWRISLKIYAKLCSYQLLYVLTHIFIHFKNKRVQVLTIFLLWRKPLVQIYTKAIFYSTK